jgi:misacylated tRNA(Ala) deacylase
MKNYDPFMHTAEHVLNQVMVRLFNVERAFSSHLERKKSKCDYHFNRLLTNEEEKEISDSVNDQLTANLPVEEKRMDRVEAEMKFNLGKLPDDADEKIRIVSVGDFDACPCIGDHVSNTSEVGTFVLVSTSFNDRVLRVRFKLNR